MNDKIINDNVQLVVNDKQGKEVASFDIRNRLLDNFLNYFIFYNLPASVKNATYPRFATTFENQTGMLRNVYLSFDVDQTITDTDVSMTYNALGDLVFMPYVVPASFDGSKLFSIGFGTTDIANNASIGIADYLLSWIDVKFLDIQVFEGYEIFIRRNDRRINNYSQINATSDQYNVNTKASFAQIFRLTKISFAYDEGGTLIDFTSNVADLTLLESGIGELTISGLPNFKSPQTSGLYPSSTTYPGSTTYPSKPPQYKSVVLEFENDILIDPIYTTVTPIKDLDITYDGGTTEIKYRIERGS